VRSAAKNRSGAQSSAQAGLSAPRPKRRKSRCHGGLSDGETRTRTGDTTIFSRAALGSEYRRFAGDASPPGVVPGVRVFPDFALVSPGLRQTAGPVCLFFRLGCCGLRAVAVHRLVTRRARSARPLAPARASSSSRSPERAVAPGGGLAVEDREQRIGSSSKASSSAGRGGDEYVCADAVEERGIPVVGDAVGLGVSELV
jgi:hypothetical protein